MPALCGCGSARWPLKGHSAQGSSALLSVQVLLPRVRLHDASGSRRGSWHVLGLEKDQLRVRIHGEVARTCVGQLSCRDLYRAARHSALTGETSQAWQSSTRQLCSLQGWSSHIFISHRSHQHSVTHWQMTKKTSSAPDMQVAKRQHVLKTPSRLLHQSQPAGSSSGCGYATGSSVGTRQRQMLFSIAAQAGTATARAPGHCCERPAKGPSHAVS